MPPKIRNSKTKENVNRKHNKKLKLETLESKIKHPRKPLADKTNSASDDNSLSSSKPSKKYVENTQDVEISEGNRPCRTRRVPKRFLNNSAITDSPNISSKNLKSTLSKNSKDYQTKIKASPLKSITAKQVNQNTSTSFVKSRPKRVYKLPSKDGNALSPKYSPIKPVHASTPIVEHPKNNRSKVNIAKNVDNNTNLKRKLVSDSNNNGQDQKTPYISNLQALSPNPVKLVQSRPKRTVSKLNENVFKNTSLKVLQDRKTTSNIDASKLDVYEFTYDPNEEPPPKKKRKKIVKKNPSKPKPITFKNNYEKNLAKALVSLKNTVAAKTLQKTEEKPQKHVSFRLRNAAEDTHKDIEQVSGQSGPNPDNVNENAHNSVRIEDIALQFQEDNHNIDYSPINSPGRTTPIQDTGHKFPLPTHTDPLNLNENLSFFDDVPAASSSMNTSKHPLASPWRVEFNNLPIKWTVNTYVKPNMTPSVETSFVNFNETKKKHVYTNIVPEEHDLPEMQETTPSLKQTSILSFIKEMAEKSVKKKKKNIKNSSDHNDIPTIQPPHVTPVKNNSLNESLSPQELTLESTEKNDSHVLKEKQNNIGPNAQITPNTRSKDSAKKKNKDITYFGFDDSENQENISPEKKNHKVKNLRSRSHAVLKEINNVKHPSKVVVVVVTPSTAKSNTLENPDKLFDEVKSATEPPMFPEVNVEVNPSISDTSDLESPRNIENEDSQSVHLFEDIEVNHHLKTNRKSYSKSKKVTFFKNANPDSNSDVDNQHNSSVDTDDESFRIPSVKQKKQTKKKKSKPKLSKKEEQEVEAWAAGFNSMCEDVQEFDLVVE